jgi:hypothetical protein
MSPNSHGFKLSLVNTFTFRMDPTLTLIALNHAIIDRHGIISGIGNSGARAVFQRRMLDAVAARAVFQRRMLDTAATRAVF